jgi:hypothetical protein
MPDGKFNKFNYNNEFAKDRYDRITILRKKNSKVTKKDIDSIAKSRNMKTSEFINMCIDEKLKRLGYDVDNN